MIGRPREEEMGGEEKEKEEKRGQRREEIRQRGVEKERRGKRGGKEEKGGENVREYLVPPYPLHMDISFQSDKTHPSDFGVCQWVGIMQFLWFNKFHFLNWRS